MNIFNNVSEIIFKLGGTGVVSRLINTNPSTISNWKKNNSIPKSYMPKLVELLNKIDYSKNNSLEDTYPNFLNSTLFLPIKILVIISGGIACYKILELLRMMYKTKYDVNVILTESAEKFISPLLISSLINKKCFTSLFSHDEGENMNHINLGRENELILVAPCTANFLAKFANGLADDLASSVLLATKNKVLIAPSMNPFMWENPATQYNIGVLKKRGIEFINPDTGITACGEEGTGRLPENKTIFNYIKNNIVKINKNKKIEKSKKYKVLITAGPTRENIDPIRYISNNSSGKQGFAIAEEFKKNGDNVTLISGPTKLNRPHVDKFIEVCSGEEMLSEVEKNINCDIFIGAAAVCDWKFIPYNSQNKRMLTNVKLKKEHNILFKTLKNPDILQTVGSHPNRPKFVVGFAAETDNVTENAKMKLISKKLDLIIANEINNHDSVFGSDFNQIIIIDSHNIKKSPRLSKNDISKLIVRKIYKHLDKYYVKSNN